MTNAETPPNLSSLLLRVEEATGADRELDDDIARWQGWTQHSDADDPVYRKPQLWCAEPGQEWSTCSVVPPYTASLDAALALCSRVLPGSTWDVGSVQHGEREFYSAIVWPAGGDPDSGECHSDANPALALVSALLRSLIAASQDGTAEAELGPGNPS